LYCFGGFNIHIEKDKIKTVEVLYWDDYIKYTPVLLITLKDETQISIDYNSIEEAETVAKEYKKEFIKRIEEINK
jgi:hypothetical protein